MGNRRRRLSAFPAPNGRGGPDRRSKYGNRKTLWQGILYDSALEARVAADLHARLRARELRLIKRQVPFPLVVNQRLIKRYVADFVITLADGRQEVLEAKGAETREWILTRKLFCALYPDIPLRVVKD